MCLKWRSWAFTKFRRNRSSGKTRYVIRDVAFVALSFDHKVVDGADAARFTSKLVSVLQNPGLMILDGVQFE